MNARGTFWGRSASAEPRLVKFRHRMMYRLMRCARISREVDALFVIAIYLTHWRFWDHARAAAVQFKSWHVPFEKARRVRNRSMPQLARPLQASFHAPHPHTLRPSIQSPGRRTSRPRRSHL